MGADEGYGLWALAALSSAMVILFAASFLRPRSRRDWKAMGAFSAFTIALFAEMYGFPLTVYLLSGWLGSRFPGLSLSHEGGHLWNSLIGWQGDAHVSPFHLLSYVLIIGGSLMVAAAWKVLHRAARHEALATEGPYRMLRHPQYAGFLLVMVGFLVQWPTIPTLIMFPALALTYRHLAIQEEIEMRDAFGAVWDGYAAAVPRFLPRFRRQRPPSASDMGVGVSGHLDTAVDPLKRGMLR